MKSLSLGIVLFVILGNSLGCGISTTKTISSSQMSKPTSLVISWSSDGNPLVPVCNGATQNCKKDITILDKTTGTEVTVAITAMNYIASNPNDSYVVRVNGFDGQGNSISSAYEAVPVE
jgi:hypothetical protein